MPDKVFLPPPVMSPVVRTGGQTSPVQKPESAAKDFAAHLAAAWGLQLSRHAEERLAQRGISIGGETWGRLLTAVAKVEAKGGRDSLVLLGDLALVVNVPNRTVVTAVAKESMKERVFTNIDSAVIV